jgi:deazaflavin-dependent oxidoreductase (nitroreductase family)
MRQMTRRKRLKRSVMMLVWRIFNPPNRLLAGIAPWWVLIETVGRRTGKQRRTPLARGPFDIDTTWLISVHGRNASWVKNLEYSPTVRLRVKRRWRTGTASVVRYDPEIIRRFNRYARAGPVTVGIDPALIRIDLLHE